MPIVVADAGLLSNDSITALEVYNYEYILDARLRMELKNVITNE